MNPTIPSTSPPLAAFSPPPNSAMTVWKSSFEPASDSADVGERQLALPTFFSTNLSIPARFLARFYAPIAMKKLGGPRSRAADHGESASHAWPSWHRFDASAI